MLELWAGLSRANGGGGGPGSRENRCGGRHILVREKNNLAEDGEMGMMEDKDGQIQGEIT